MTALALALAVALSAPPQPASPGSAGRGAPSATPPPSSPPQAGEGQGGGSTPSSTWPGPDSASAKADRSEVRLGEPFTVTVTVKHAPGERWSLAPKQSLKPFVIVGAPPKAEAAPAGTREVTTLSLRLALFELDSRTVPDLGLVATDGRASHDFSLPGPTVKGVAPDLAKDRGRRDIAGPLSFYVRNLRLLWIALGALGALALAAAGIVWWRRRPARARAAPDAPPRPEDELALEALARLEAEGLASQGRAKEFHLRLSEALRGYLGARYGIFALDMTSAELIDRLERLPTSGLRLADVSWVCAQGDLAKFAKAQPTPDDCKQALDLVRQTILRTRRPRPPDGAAGAVANGAAA